MNTETPPSSAVAKATRQPSPKAPAAPSNAAERPSTKKPAERRQPGTAPVSNVDSRRTRTPRPISVATGVYQQGERVVIYGAGGIGKTSLIAALNAVEIPVLFIDLEAGTQRMNVTRVQPSPENWEELRSALHSDLVDDFGAIAIDGFTKAEEFAGDWVVRNVQKEKGGFVERLSDFPFGRGYDYVYDTFLLLLQDLDAICRRGIHVVATCHDCVASVPNPSGQDFLQYQPRLQCPPKLGQVRPRVKEWADHLLFIGYDRFVSEDGKAQGSGSRAIYPYELPTHWAKSRSIEEAFQFEKGDASLWVNLFGKETES